MKRVLFPLIPVILLFSLPTWGSVFEPYTVKRVPGSFYFTPATSSREWAIFGYMSKITPTPQEIEAEKKRVTAIIDQGIEREYGSWENYEKAMREAGEKAARELKGKGSSPVRTLIPVDLLKEGVPFFMTWPLKFANAFPEAMREPVGNVGETGVVLMDGAGGTTRIPLGMNAPVISIDILPDGTKAAVLTDMSFEGKDGKLHLVGEISLIDLRARRRVRNWIFSNLAWHVKFVPALPHMLAFTVHTDMKDFSKKELRFIALKSGRVTKHHFPVTGSGTGNVFGKKINRPGFVFSPKSPVVAIYDKGFFQLYNILTGKKLFRVKTSSHVLTFANKHPWIFTGIGELWDYEKKERLATVNLIDPGVPLREAQFSGNDQRIFYLDWWKLKCFDLSGGQTLEGRERGGLFFVTPDDSYFIAFVPGKQGIMAYKKRYLRRQQLCLRIFSSRDLHQQQDICYKDATVIDAAIAGQTLIVSDFERLHFYVNAAAMRSDSADPRAEKSFLAKIAANPAKFAGKIIEMDGWAWGWMARPPRPVMDRSIPMARHNYGSKNDGTFTDGVLCVLYPVPVGFSGRFHLKARVKLTPFGWQLVPVREGKSKGR